MARHYFGLRLSALVVLAAALLGVSGNGANAACDANTSGTSTCTGTLTNIDKTATGDLTVLLQNVQVTTDGISVDGTGGIRFQW